MEHTHDFPAVNGVILDTAVCSTCGTPVMEGAALFPSSTLDTNLPEGEPSASDRIVGRHP